MYAIVECGSHQFHVEEGDEIVLDRLKGNEEGFVEFDTVLLIGGKEDGPIIGTPVIAGAKVVGKIVKDFRGKKVIIQKFRRRKNMRRRRGHRQSLTRVLIQSVVSP